MFSCCKTQRFVAKDAQNIKNGAHTLTVTKNMAI